MVDRARLRGGIGPAPVPGGRPRKSPGHPDVGARVGGEAGRGGTSGAGIGRTARGCRHAWWIPRSVPGSWPCAGSALAVASRHDDAGRAQTIARILDQGCLPDASRNDDRGGDPLANGSLHRFEHPRPKRSCDARRTDPVALARLRALAAETSDGQIAQILNREGFRSDGRPFTTNMVRQLRYSYSIASGCPDNLSACAEALGRMGAAPRVSRRICSR